MNYHFKWTYWSFYYEPSKCLIKAASVTFWQSYLETLFCYVQRFQIQVLIFVFFFKKADSGKQFYWIDLSPPNPCRLTPVCLTLFHLLLASMVYDETSIHSIVSLLLIFVFCFFYSLSCFQQFHYVVSGHGFHWAYPIWGSLNLESTRKGLCLSPNLGSFWPLFL